MHIFAAYIDTCLQGQTSKNTIGIIANHALGEHKTLGNFLKKWLLVRFIFRTFFGLFRFFLSYRGRFFFRAFFDFFGDF